jgi:hypothetical protein
MILVGDNINSYSGTVAVILDDKTVLLTDQDIRWTDKDGNVSVIHEFEEPHYICDYADGFGSVGDPHCSIRYIMPDSNGNSHYIYVSYTRVWDDHELSVSFEDNQEPVEVIHNEDAVV